MFVMPTILRYLIKMNVTCFANRTGIAVKENNSQTFYYFLSNCSIVSINVYHSFLN